ncbi:telomerase protein component 1-like isoform X2 [Tubulanus polymorphus]|uniref:telomerase protein component 1-like isoform X2 n=1 Tax=Tubulanus polymorphus TaxID=672921 RepID=UPI003DA688FD
MAPVMDTKCDSTVVSTKCSLQLTSTMPSTLMSDKRTKASFSVSKVPLKGSSRSRSENVSGRKSDVASKPLTSLGSLKNPLLYKIPSPDSNGLRGANVGSASLGKSSLTTCLSGKSSLTTKSNLLSGSSISGNSLRLSGVNLTRNLSSTLTGSSSTYKSLLTTSLSGRSSSPLFKPSAVRSSGAAGLKTEKRESYTVHDNIVHPMPYYDLTDEAFADEKFLVAEELPIISMPLEPAFGETLEESKRTLINAVSSSLIHVPNYKDQQDEQRLKLIKLAEDVTSSDPEFILKLALYTRRELNIRSTANFLLALSAYVPGCRAYLKKYFKSSVMLPSDWIDVPTLYQIFDDSRLNFGSLPSALRRVLVAKFPDFDKYQLAKYNKQTKPKAQGQKKDVATSAGSSANFNANNEVVSDPQSDTEEERERRTFSLKQLIRCLHVPEPVDHCMSLVGKRYPESLEEFYQLRLPGTWDQERAGKRMKLPTPETWETQVSLKGNKAVVWEELIDHKKLPFMAMLRNLRNMIRAGISEAHHHIILKKLSDEGAVTHSKQFPFRFFSAYEVLNSLEDEYGKNQNDLIQNAIDSTTTTRQKQGARGRGRGRGGVRGRGGRSRGFEKKPLQETKFDLSLIQRYRKALDTAVKIATTFNVKPIKGTTLIFADVNNTKDQDCRSFKGCGKKRMMSDVGLLLGLMCKYACEECDMVLFGTRTDGSNYQKVELEKGIVLTNMERLQIFKTTLNGLGSAATAYVPEKLLTELLVDGKQIDNLIMLTYDDDDQRNREIVKNFLVNYRHMVNPNLLYVNVDLTGGRTQRESKHPNDVYISGFSDQILRFVAERGGGGQLNHVEKIDEKYNLIDPTLGLKKPMLAIPENPLSIPLPTPRWRSARVFISSTFRDMHGERDILTRYVFPELRARASAKFINVYEVDLRWGVTEEDTRSNKTLELCLSEVNKCQFFIGLLGDRYGWVPDDYVIPDSSEFDWLKCHPKGASLTELEMVYGALAKPDETRERAFFFLRDNSFMSDVPKERRKDFVAENKRSEKKMLLLKSRIKSSGIECFDGYPCQWGGVVDGKPITAGLEEFGRRALNNLWNAILKYYPDEKDALLDEELHQRLLQEAYAESQRQLFTGREALIKQCSDHIRQLKTGTLLIHGKSGSGKTAFMAQLIHNMAENRHHNTFIISHFVGGTPGSNNIVVLLRHLCHMLYQNFHNDSAVFPQEYKNLVETFHSQLETAHSVGCRLILFLDGLDNLTDAHDAKSLMWLPNPMIQNVLVVGSVVEHGACHKNLSYRKCTGVGIGPLNLLEKADIVRQRLAIHRKTLDESPFNNQMKALTSKKDGNHPLYLSLACEELRVFGVFEKIGEKLKSMPQTVHSLLQDILARLESDHGKVLIATALSLLACVRDGLLDEELYATLSYGLQLKSSSATVQAVINMKLSADELVPPAKYAGLLRSIRTFLRETTANMDGPITLAHNDIIEAVHHRYLRGFSSGRELHLHAILAGYFYQQACQWNMDVPWCGKNIRAFKELPYHLACCGDYKTLGETLCDLIFICRKCQYGKITKLLDDFQVPEIKGTGRERLKFLNSQRIVEYREFLKKNQHIFIRFPNLVTQQAANDVPGSAPYVDGQMATKSRSQSMMFWQNQSMQKSQCSMTIPGFNTPVTCVAMSPDNQSFVCGTKNNIVKMFDIDTGKELRIFIGHSDAITSICFAGSDRLCTASADNTLSLWNVNDGHRIAIMKGHNREVRSCACNRSGELIASASWDCKVKIWSGKDGKLMTSYITDYRPVNCVAFHPQQDEIITGGWDATIKIWNIFEKRNNRKAILRGHMTSVRHVSYSPDGIHIASAALDGEVKLWSATNGSQIATISGHALAINSLTFSNTGRELVTVSDDQKVKVWSGNLGVLMNTLQAKDREDFGPAACVKLANNGEAMAVGYHEGFVQAWSIEDLNNCDLMFESKIHESRVNCISIHKYELHARYCMFSGGDDGWINVMQLSNTNETICKRRDHDKAVTCMYVDDIYVITGSDDCTAIVYIQSGFDELFSDSDEVALNLSVTLRGHEGRITGISMSSDGSSIVTSSRDMSLKIWNIATGCLQNTIDSCHSDWINSCACSDDADFVATGSNDFTIKVWDLKNQKEKVKMVGHMSAINSVAYKHGCVVSGCFDGSVKIWSHKGTAITTLYGHTQRVNGCDMHVKLDQKPDVRDDRNELWGNIVESFEWEEKHKKVKTEKSQSKVETVIVATCSDDGTVKLWKPLQPNELSCMNGHSDRVMAVATNRSGKVVTSSLDRTVRIWTPDLKSGASDISVHNSAVSSIAKSFDYGQYVISGSRDGQLKVHTEAVTSPTGLMTFDVKCTLQAHSKVITGISFVDPMSMRKPDNKFITSSLEEDGNSLKFWALKNDGKISKTSSQIEPSGPITFIVSNMYSESKRKVQILYIGYLTGLVQAWDLQRNELILSEEFFKKRGTQVTKIYALEYGFVVTSVSLLMYCKFKPNWTVRKGHALSEYIKATVNIGALKDQANFITAVTAADEHPTQLLIGDTRGCVTTVTSSENLKILKSVKAHSAEVTGIVINMDTILTSSRDKTIKVWTFNWKQVGVYFTAAVPTSVIHYDVMMTPTALIYGDELGALNCIAWLKSMNQLKQSCNEKL